MRVKKDKNRSIARRLFVPISRLGHGGRVALTLVISLAAVNNTSAQSSNSSFDDIVNAAQSNMDAYQQQFNDYAEAVTAEYERYEKAVMEEYKAHCEEVKGLWGDNEVVESGAKSWVEYNDDQSERSVVDFEQGTVKVELLVDIDDLDDQSLIDKKMEGAVEQLLSSQGKSLNYNSEYEESKALSDEPILNQQIDLSAFGISSEPSVVAAVAPSASSASAVAPPAPPAPPAPKSTSSATLPSRSARESATTSGATMVSDKDSKDKAAKDAEAAKVAEAAKAAEAKKAEAAKKAETAKKAASQPAVTVTPQNVVAVAETIVKQSTPTTQVKENGDGKKVAVVTLNLKLVEDQVSTRAAKFKETVEKYSKKFDVESSIIYSIMEQESSFNPAAKSWVPAYGLMQLVPKSGGRDAYNYVYKKDIIPTADYLFDSNNNIELGTAYLKRVRVGYFGKVTDPKCQLLCVIASYNCGAGNVSRAIIGSTNLPKAIPLINEMSYDELYAKLSKNLPDETKDYIYKVTRNLSKYSGGKY